MATTEPKRVKQLKELLQEQQEPFILELYLIQKGYLKRKRFIPRSSSFNCCHGNSRKSLKRSISSGFIERSKKGIPHCSKVLKAVYNQVISLNQKIRIKSYNHINGNDKEIHNRNSRAAEEFDTFSSASSFNSCCLSDAEEPYHIFTPKNKNLQSLTLFNPTQKEALTDRKQQWKCIDESRQLSPVSVLEEGASHDKTEYSIATKEKNSSITFSFLPKKVTQDSILSSSLWNILVHSSSEKDESSKYLKTKTFLQQTRRFLFYFVGEIVEAQGWKKQPQKELLATDEIGKFIGEKIKLWGKQFLTEAKLKELLELEFLNSTQEWICNETQKRIVGFEIADAILEDVKNEIVTGIIGLSSSITGG